MSRDKQIAEMAKVIRYADIAFVKARVDAIERDLSVLPYDRGDYLANILYNAGYRKADEIFEEIDSCIFLYSTHGIFSSAKYAELKKKYEREKDNG